MVLVDLAAGVEFMGRASVQGIDALVLVVEPGGRSIETANNMAKMGRELGIDCIAAIANKITEISQTETIKSQLHNVDLLGNLQYSRALQQADLGRAPVFGVDIEITNELKQIKDQLTKLVSMVK
jgi:CO dehydrogenase maturation factor